MVLGGVSLDMAFQDENTDNMFSDNRDYNNLPEVTPIQRSSPISNLKKKPQQQQQQQDQQQIDYNDIAPRGGDGGIHPQMQKLQQMQQLKQMQQMQEMQQMQHLEQKNYIKTKKNNVVVVDNEMDDSDITFFDKLKMKQSEVKKFLTLCAILLVALCYHDFIKLSINKIADNYNFKEINKYYLILAVPTLLLFMIMYFLI
jgi:DNA-directed RNA polymerase alpha subunit